MYYSKALQQKQNGLGIVTFVKKNGNANLYNTRERQLKEEYRIATHRVNVAAFATHSMLSLLLQLKSRLIENLSPEEITSPTYKRYFDKTDQLESIAKNIHKKINEAIESDEEREDYYRIAEYGNRRLQRFYVSMEETFFNNLESYFPTKKHGKISSIIATFRTSAEIANELVNSAVTELRNRYPKSPELLHQTETKEIFDISTMLTLLSMEESKKIEYTTRITTKKEIDAIFDELTKSRPSLFDEARNK